MLRQAEDGNDAERADRASVRVRLERMCGILDERNLEPSTLRAELGYAVGKPVRIACQDRGDARPRGVGHRFHTDVPIVCGNRYADGPKSCGQCTEKHGVVLEW
jgi:hypothetical protein